MSLKISSRINIIIFAHEPLFPVNSCLMFVIKYDQQTIKGPTSHSLQCVWSRGGKRGKKGSNSSCQLLSQVSSGNNKNTQLPCCLPGGKKKRSWKCMEFYRALLRLCTHQCFENYFFACSEKGNPKIGHIFLNIFFLGQVERTSKFPYFRPTKKEYPDQNNSSRGGRGKWLEELKKSPWT